MVPANEDIVVYGPSQNENCVEWNLTEEEFWNFWNIKLFKRINKKCNIIIDDCEIEHLPLKQIENFRNVLQKAVNKNKISESEFERFEYLIALAIRNGSSVCFAF